MPWNNSGSDDGPGGGSGGPSPWGTPGGGDGRRPGGRPGGPQGPWNGGPRGSGEVKNEDLWRQLDELLGRHRVRFTHVRGHTGHVENERCDTLAVAAYQKFL